MSHVEHQAQAPASIGCYVLTVSDTRTPETDASGRAIRALLESSGHRVIGHAIVADEPDVVTQAVEREIADGRVEAIILTGGTGSPHATGRSRRLTGCSTSASTASASCSACSASTRSALRRC